MKSSELTASSLMHLIVLEHGVTDEECISIVRLCANYCVNVESLERMKRIVDTALAYENQDVS